MLDADDCRNPWKPKRTVIIIHHPPRTPKKQWEINGGIQVSGLTCEEPAMKHDETMTSIVLEEKKMKHGMFKNLHI